MRFGLSTHVFHDARLTRDHLRLVADAGFGAIELFAGRGHFAYDDPAAVDQLRDWLHETALTLWSVHAPIAEGLTHGVWSGPYSNACADASRRVLAVREATLALEIARRVPFSYLVVHVGVPPEQAKGADNQPDAARTSLVELDEATAGTGVRLALEVIPNSLSQPERLVRLIEDELEDGAPGICVDVGHAHLMGDVVDAIETASGHLVTTHVHDNDGRRDEHLVPFEGSIDWAPALMALQKVGFDGVLMLELAAADLGAGSGGPAGARAVLDRARAARKRMEDMLAS